MSDRDRDELIKIMHVAGADYVSADYIHDRRHSDTGTSFKARRILAAGWRKSTVTPEQIEAAARAVQKAEAECDYRIDSAHYECGNTRRPPTLVTWESLPSEEHNHYLANASVAARAFGRTPEDVT